MRKSQAHRSGKVCRQRTLAHTVLAMALGNLAPSSAAPSPKPYDYSPVQVGPQPTADIFASVKAADLVVVGSVAWPDYRHSGHVVSMPERSAVESTAFPIARGDRPVIVKVLRVIKGGLPNDATTISFLDLPVAWDTNNHHPRFAMLFFQRNDGRYPRAVVNLPFFIPAAPHVPADPRGGVATPEFRAAFEAAALFGVSWAEGAKIVAPEDRPIYVYPPDVPALSEVQQTSRQVGWLYRDAVNGLESFPQEQSCEAITAVHDGAAAPLGKLVSATELLGFCRQPARIQEVRKLWEQADPLDRGTAKFEVATAVGETRMGLTATDDLVALMRDPDPVIREAAVSRLSQTPSPGAIAPLVAALSDTNPRVRLHAVVGLCWATRACKAHGGPKYFAEPGNETQLVQLVHDWMKSSPIHALGQH